jgi:hypothetical protein
VARLTLPVDLSDPGAIGPGKIRLLELVGESGSMSAAGRAMKMSHRRAGMRIRRNGPPPPHAHAAPFPVNRSWNRSEEDRR